MNRPLPLGLIALFFTAPITAAGLDAHQHGVAQLDIAQEGQTLELAFHSPLNNLVGFEHPPRTEQQHQALEQAEALLRQGTTLFLLPESAGCTLSSVALQTPFTDTDHDHAEHDSKHQDQHAAHEGEHHDAHAAHEDEHHHEHAAHEDKHHDEHDHEGSHADMGATWRFECSAPEHLGRFETGLFDHFPALERLQVQSFSDHGQRGQELSAQQRVIELP